MNYCIASVFWWIGESWIGEDLAGSGSGLSEVLPGKLFQRNWVKYSETQTGQPVSQPRFELGLWTNIIYEMIYDIWYDMIWYVIYLSTAIGLIPHGSSTVHIYTQTVHRTTHFTNLEECWPCPVFESYTLVFVLQLRKKHGKTSVRVAEECQYSYYQNTHTHITKPTTLQPPTHYKTIQNHHNTN
jgi:hypothetical protein